MYELNTVNHAIDLFLNIHYFLKWIVCVQPQIAVSTIWIGQPIVNELKKYIFVYKMFFETEFEREKTVIEIMPNVFI